jgi:HlyD family secretion protein
MFNLIIKLLLLFAVFAPGIVFAKSVENVGSAMVVSFTQARNGALQASLEAYGKVVPRNDVSVATIIERVHIVDVLAEEGDYVEKGQLLARLDDTALKFALDSLQAELTKAKNAFIRSEKLQKTSAISQEESDLKRSEYLRLTALVADAKFRLRQADVIAPAAGIVYQRNVTAGQITRPDEPLFKIARDGVIELEVDVAEEYVPRITLETPVSVKLMSERQPRQASVRLISPRVDTTSRMAKIRLNFPASAGIPINMFCSARFILPGQRGLVLANSALQRDKDGDYVWLVQQDGSVRRRNIEIVARESDQALVTGIDERDNVVARAGSFLQDGDLVTRADEVSR